MHNGTTQIFNQPDAVVEGWYWALRSSELKRGKAKPASLFGRELVIYRTADGSVVALDAHCPHMGAHLSLGRVEGDAIRCFFHGWKYDATGRCADVPCQPGAPPRAQVQAHHACERAGLIWIWIGDAPPTHEVPVPTELRDVPFESMVASRFKKGCHPNVVMINAIDEHHFQTVHRLPGHILHMEPVTESRHQIDFRNTGVVPRNNLLGRFVARFYKGPLTYNLSYWYGNIGIVTMGPDFLHLYIMFALRPTPEYHTDGCAIAFTKKRRGTLGWIFNRVLLIATRFASMYFAKGDTKIFETIRFDLKTPIAADRAVVAFVRHVEQQQLTNWAKGPNRETTAAQEGRSAHAAT